MSKVKEDTAKVDNTAVVKPKVFERLRVTPRKYELVDLGGTPSNDTRTPAERNKDYLHPIKGAKERFKASMSNETNPLVGIERTILPSAAGAALVTTPIALAKGAGYGFGIDKLTGGWGNMVERTTGIPSEIAQYTNPGAIIGGAAGYRLDQKNLLSKFIKGDADLAWNPINKNHWIFNKEARTASNIGMAVTNRLAPFLQGVEKLPLKVAAYKTAKRTKGNASVTLSEIKGNPSDYAKRWNESPNAPDQVRLTKQAALMDKVGTPFILQQSNPIWIEGRSVRQAMKVGGKFTFKKSPAVKDAEKLNGKRDMRKKFVKSSRPTYKRRIRKGQVGMRFVSYVPVNNPTIDYTDITNPINPFSEYYIPTTYNTEQALVVPEREDSKSDTVEETPVVASKPIAEPVVNKPVASKVVNNTANSTWSSPYKDRSKWAADLTNAYKRAGITNDNAIRMLVSQDALESAWGRSAQGKFNFGNLTTGAKWQGDYVTGNDHDAAGNPIKQKFRSYNSMDEYAADKVQFLKRLYDFDENDDINKFVAKLTGSNKGKRRYAEAGNYAKLLTGVYNGISKGQNGLVVQRRDATYVSPTYHNSPYRDVNYKPTSEIEIVSPKWTMQDGRLIKTTSQIKNRVIPLETVSPEFDVLTGIRGMASLLGNKPKPMIFKSNTSKLAKAERMGIPKGERNSPSPYKQIGTVDEVSEHYMKATGDIFGPFMDKQSEHAVFNHATDPSKIVKVYAVNDKGFADIAAIKEFQAHYMKRNQIPFGVKNRFSGYLKGKDGIFPVYTQDKVTPLKAMNNTQYEKEIFPKLVEQLKAKGYTQTSPDVFSNGKFKITDLYPDNMGYDSQGNLIFFDAKTYRFGGLLGRRHRL
jgi:flagellum-specific peptidoglycan hydrolase FlgJ